MRASLIASAAFLALCAGGIVAGALGAEGLAWASVAASAALLVGFVLGTENGHVQERLDAERRPGGQVRPLHAPVPPRSQRPPSPPPG